MFTVISTKEELVTVMFMSEPGIKDTSRSIQLKNKKQLRT